MRFLEIFEYNEFIIEAFVKRLLFIVSIEGLTDVIN